MPELPLLASALYGVPAAVAFAYLGHRFQRRPASAEGRTALRLYGVWWFGLAGVVGTESLATALAAFGVRNVPFHLAVAHVGLLALCAALWGLMYYVFFMLMGRGRTLPILTGFFLANYFLLVAFLTYSQPSRVEVSGWHAGVAFDARFEAMMPVFWVLLGLPLFLATLGMFAVHFRSASPTQRFRTFAVPFGILLWLEAKAVALAPWAAGSDAVQAAAHVAGLAAALLLLFAYAPPSWLRRGFALDTLDPGPEPESIGS